LDLIARFASLKIDGCGTADLAMRTEKKIFIEISRTDDAKRVSDYCELQFLGLLDARVALLGTPWLGLITAHHAYSDSPYLVERRDSSHFLDRLKRQGRDLANWKDYYHFSITFEQSSIDVVAQDFVFYTVAKFPWEPDFDLP